MADLDNIIEISCSSSRLLTSFMISCIISPICSSLSLLNMTISSILFINSGRNVVFKADSIDVVNFSLSLMLSVKDLKPILSLGFSVVPKLLVIMIIVLVKFTVLPLPSVRRPSSSICNKILNTSGWAFSISSKSIN